MDEVAMICTMVMQRDIAHLPEKTLHLSCVLIVQAEGFMAGFCLIAKCVSLELERRMA